MWQCTVTISQQIALAVLLLLQCISNGAAIKCFVCDSSDNPSCADLNTNSSIVPEECTLDKMKSIDTWLFELNKFAYFDTGGNRSPLMFCQKVVARDPNTSKMVTARFCQLDTADSDACSILRSKLRVLEDSKEFSNNANDRRGGNAGVGGGGSSTGTGTNKRSHQPAEEDVDDNEQFHCSICRSDRCNGSSRQHTPHIGVQLMASVLSIVMIMKMTMKPAA